MLVIGTFWSYVIIIIIELLKIGAVLVALVSAAGTRTEFVIVKRYIEDKELPKWLYGVDDWGYYNETLAATAGYREEERIANNLSEKYRYYRLKWYFWQMLAGLATYAALQFGPSRANAYSAAKLGVVLTLTLVFGLFACLDEKTPRWHTRVFTPLVVILAVSPLLLGLTGIAPTYGTPDNVWDFEEEEILFEDIQRFAPYTADGAGTRLGLDISQGGKVSVTIDGENFVPEETKNFAIKLIIDATMSEDYGTRLVRREGNIYVRNYTCRLPIIWTMSKSHQVVYEFHYANQTVFSDGIRLNNEVVLPGAVVAPATT